MIWLATKADITAHSSSNNPAIIISATFLSILPSVSSHVLTPWPYLALAGFAKYIFSTKIPTQMEAPTLMLSKVLLSPLIFFLPRATLRAHFPLHKRLEYHLSPSAVPPTVLQSLMPPSSGESRNWRGKALNSK
jgi:hypothetical protein